MPTLHVVIPVFNEAETLATILDGVQAVALPEPWHIHITVVDDGSSANFAEILEETIADRPVDLIRHKHNQGKGPPSALGLTQCFSAGKNAMPWWSKMPTWNTTPTTWPLSWNQLPKGTWMRW